MSLIHLYSKACVSKCTGGGCEGTSGCERESSQAVPEFSKHQPRKNIQEILLNFVVKVLGGNYHGTMAPAPLHLSKQAKGNVLAVFVCCG